MFQKLWQTSNNSTYKCQKKKNNFSINLFKKKMNLKIYLKRYSFIKLDVLKLLFARNALNVRICVIKYKQYR